MSEDKKKILIITGAALCVMEDVRAALSTIMCYFHESGNPVFETSDADFMAIGLDAVDKYLWPVKYFATYHPSEIKAAMERRAGFGGNTDYFIISHQQHPDKATGRDLVGLIIPCEPPSGSSALLGVLAGIKIGYKKIIVCGCPLTGTNDKGYDYAKFRAGWTAKFNEIKGYTRSMSGWTRELLGYPDKEWILK